MEHKDALDLKTKVLNEWKEEPISISEELWNRMEEERREHNFQFHYLYNY